MSEIICYYGNTTLRLCCKEIFQLLVQRKSSVFLRKRSSFDEATVTSGEISVFCIFGFDTKQISMIKPRLKIHAAVKAQIELITWHVRSPGLKHYRHFNSVLCNEHQHRRRGNQFQYNCPKMSFLAAIIPHGSQSKQARRQHWRPFTLARWTFITIDFSCLRNVPFLYPLMIWICHSLLRRFLTKRSCKIPTSFVASNSEVMEYYASCKKNEALIKRVNVILNVL